MAPRAGGSARSYAPIPSVLEILVLYSEEIRADLQRREEDGTWPDNPLTPGDDVTLESIDFAGGSSGRSSRE